MQQEHQPSKGEPALANNQAGSRYELRIGDKVAALASYSLQGDAVRFTHTEVQPEYEGQGLGSRLAQFALDDVRTRGLKAVPQCSFIAKYIERHEAEYGSLVAR